MGQLIKIEDKMDLEVFKRDKNQNNSLRVLKNIPAVIYGKGMDNENIYLKEYDLKKILQSIVPGELATTIFSLKEGKKAKKVIVKDIQYAVTTYDVTHIDFLSFDENIAISVNVPINVINGQESKGVKLGGNIQQIIKSVKVKCLAKDLPKTFIVDAIEMDVGSVYRLSDIKLPSGVKILAKNLNEVVISLKKQ